MKWRIENLVFLVETVKILCQFINQLKFVKTSHQTFIMKFLLNSNVKISIQSSQSSQHIVEIVLFSVKLKILKTYQLNLEQTRPGWRKYRMQALISVQNEAELAAANDHT